MYEMAPAHLKAHFKDRMEMDPETRKADLAVRQAEAAAKQAAEIGAMTDKVIEQRKIEREIADKEILKEEIRQGKPNQLPKQADPNSIKLEFAMSTDTVDVGLNYLLDPYLPERCVVGFYGRGSSAKSSFVATMAAHISSVASTLWISVEELKDWIKVRHVKAGGADATLQVVTAVVTQKDNHGRAVGSSFNVYEHLEPAIRAAKTNLMNVPHEYSRPLKLVVLDTAVALTTWTASAGPNSDEGVKKLMAHLQGLAEAHDLTIAVIGHANKGKREYLADSVMGSAAWVNSPRLSFLHAADVRGEYQYVAVVAKTNLVWFGVPYTTAQVHTLYKRKDGPDSVLVKANPGVIVWGRRESEEMWDEATTIPKDDEGGFTDTRKLTVAEIVRRKLVEMVHAGQDAFITREQVETQLPEVKVNRAQWAKVDLDLRMGEIMYRVGLTTGQHNMTLYRPKLNAVPG